MSVETHEEPKRPSAHDNAKDPASPPRPPWNIRFQNAWAQVEWAPVLLTALGVAICWCPLFLANNWIQVLAGIIPVLGGLYLGRTVKTQHLLHGLLLGAISFLIGLGLIIAYGLLAANGVVPAPTVTLQQAEGPKVVSAAELILFYVSFSLFALVPFPAFGTVMAGRAEERNRETRRQVEERGGQLERPNVVRTLEDLQGLSLPQLGSYIVSLFKKKGFAFRDYRFIDKDKHLDIEMEYQNEGYLIRLSVADKVRPGTVEGLIQELKRRDLPKGIVITSTAFLPEALKSAKGRRNLITIDGQTLFDIAQ